jgi:hypothetical protein
MTNHRHILPLLLCSFTAACDRDDPEDIPTYTVDDRGALVRCGDAAYDLDQLDATLREHPELADEIAVDRVDCETAPEVIEAINTAIESFASEPLAEPEDELRIANAEAENLTHNGVLMLGNKGCTGVLIHERALITAAHCVVGLSPDGSDNFWVDGFAITNFGGGSYSGTVRVNVHPDYAGDGDAGDDIAVVKLTSGAFPFPLEDRHRMYTGPMSTIGTMRLFGQGVTSHTGGGEGILRKMVFLPDWTGPMHFLMDADTSRTCHGDSGGPVMDLLPDGVTRVVAGLHVSSDKVGNDKCATSGGKQRSVRLQNKVRWIDDMIGGTDSDDCVSLTMSGWEYSRCW